jgi:inverse autotransporter-like protein with beta domain
MITSCKKSLIVNYALKLMVFIGIFLSAAPGMASPKINLSQFDLASPEYPLDPLRQPLNRGEPKELARPEYYVNPTLKYGLELVLPANVRKRLSVDASYDRWRGVPTLQADYFMTLKALENKSLFLTPRISFSGARESYSLGMGFRQLLSDKAMIGFHASHDWVRKRNEHREFLKEVVMGVELAALPGNYSHLTFSANAYFPVNDRRSPGDNGVYSVTESLATGADASVGFLLPALVDWLDCRLDGKVHNYRGKRTGLFGYGMGLSANTRDGMLSASVEKGLDKYSGDSFRATASMTLAFDWLSLVNGKNPFSAPYAMQTERFQRELKHGLNSRINRKHEMPMDRDVTRIALATIVAGNAVSLSGAFPDLPNSRVAIQTAQSPWQDRMEVITDSQGRYRGRFKLKPGRYKIRVLHRGTGRASREQRIVIEP